MILHSCVVELVRTGLVGRERGQLERVEVVRLGVQHLNLPQLAVVGDSQLVHRHVRHVLALALFSGVVDSGAVNMEVFLDSLKQAVRKQIRDREELGKE
jgi:hypothetical protein